MPYQFANININRIMVHQIYIRTEERELREPKFTVKVDK